MLVKPSSGVVYLQRCTSSSARRYCDNGVKTKEGLHWNRTASCDRVSLQARSKNECVPSPVSRVNEVSSSLRSYPITQTAKSHLGPRHPHLLSHSSAFHTSSRQSRPHRMPHNATLQGFFDTNGKWAEAVSQHDSSFFQKSAEGQKPKVLWIGCADSRVPESVVMACKPGEVFVHRNIANQFHPNDDSAISVLTYAVENLGIKHIVVVGHTQCGGVNGAFELACNPSAAASTGNSPLGRWLTPLINLAKSHNLPSQGKEAGVPKLLDASIKTQVDNIAATSVVQNAWANGNPVTIHGWLYNLESGKLLDLDYDIQAPWDQ